MRSAAIIEAFGIRAALPVLLRALPLDRVLDTLTPPPAEREPDPRALRAIEDATDMVTRRFRPTRTACLKRALMRYRMLRREGYDASFVIGVRSGGEDGFEAHAWVTIDDAPLMEREPINYRPTFIWPPRPVTQSVTSAP
ncbi:MAG: lasso peptide biosynthesis B2 protein [Myxococcales bacterium]|nr:lasso peptide biosynthesis B2 protein [Myxococcales bacterium]